MWIYKLAVKNADIFPSFRPISKLKKRNDAEVITVFIKANKTTQLPTTLYIPRSTTPKICNTSLDVYNEINVITIILM